MLEIDGRQGEGGGQVLRSSLAFSALTQKPFVIHHIRGNRSTPGLRAQHVACVRLAASLCGAQVEGAEVGSHRVVFQPSALVAGRHEVDIGTAGSITLLTQAALIPALACKKPVELVMQGGTDVPLSPPLDFLQEVVLPYYRRLGHLELDVEKRGFMPAGQGLVSLRVHGHQQDAAAFGLLDCPDGLKARGKVVASAELEGNHVGQRVAAQVERRLGFAPEIEYRRTSSVGVVANVWGQNGEFRAGCGLLGRRRLSSEKLADQLCSRWEDIAAHDNPVEEYLADQLIPLLALCGGEIKCQTISLHCRTNVQICALFTGTEFSIEGDLVSARL